MLKLCIYYFELICHKDYFTKPCMHSSCKNRIV